MIVLRLLGILGATSITRAFGGVQKPFADGLFTKSFGQHGNGPHIPVVPDLSFNGLSYNDRLFTPVVESLSALGTDKFMKLEHPVFPNYSVRIKKSEFCDEKANVYTGYIDVEARHFFFYFFESRNDPTKDDVIFWTNGGPGCSSATGLFMELGPCRVGNDNKTHHNPYGWNNNANVFFVDQPIGVGFSYADHGEFVSSTEEAAVDMAAFVFIFFEHFSQFKGRPFHFSGESYAGRYLPVFASALYDLNTKMVKAGHTAVNLSSVMIGNGWTDFPTMAPSYYDIVCSHSEVGPILDISSCVRMKAAAPRCEKMINECFDTFDHFTCSAANSFCFSELAQAYQISGLNPYDITKKCDPSADSGLCYSILTHVAAFLSLNSTKNKLGVDTNRFPGKFESCNFPLHDDFFSSYDYLRPTKHYVTALLERDVRVLIYVGDYDWIANWIGNMRWTEALEWSGGNVYRKVPMGTWKVDGELVGKYKSSGGLTFATIRGGGHMVPYDRPKESLEMVKRWLAKVNF